MDPRQRRYGHVLGHRPLSALVEPEHIVAAAQPVLSPLAVAAFPARDDLFGDYAVADLAPQREAALASISATLPTSSCPGTTGGSQ